MSYIATGSGAPEAAGRWYSGLRGKLMIAIGVVLSGTLIAAAVALAGYGNVRSTIDVIVGQAVPAMKEGMGVAQQAERLVALAPALSSVADPKERETVSARIRQAKEEFAVRLDRLRAAGAGGDRLGAIEEASKALLGNLAQLDAAAADRVAQASLRGELLPRMLGADGQIQKFMAPWRTVIASEEEQARDTLAAPSSSPDDLRRAAATLIDVAKRAKPLASVIEESGNARNMLLEASGTSEEQRLVIIETRLGLVLANLEDAAAQLPEKLAEVATAQAGVLRATALGKDGLIEARGKELEILNRSRALVEGNHALAETLAAGIAGMVQEQETGIAAASGATGRMLDNSRLTQIAVSVVSIVVSILVVWLYVGRSVVQRLMTLKSGMRRIASGDLDADIALDGRDEIAEMGAALRVFRDTAREVEITRAQAESDRVKAAGERRQAMLTIADQFESGVKMVVETVSAAATQMHQTASTMVETAQDTSRQAGSAAAAAEQASSNVDSAASAAHELSLSITEISRQVTESATIAGQAARDAERTDATMRELNGAAARIGAVLDLITDIAGQTNLLALNATIEAARAGEAGKGFAVVASEVKQLASQTAKATDQIASQIGAMQSATGDAVEAIRTIGATIARLNDIATGIAAAVEEQGAATAEIARNVQQAAGGTAQASENIGMVRNAAGQTGQSAQAVLSVAGQVSNETSHLLQQIERFLNQVRSA
ncbi:methyl-accepting chemotaxis protein [Azospirillum doebereinerae]|uniref:HAMP domain-containing protein n=1 Tax=Azospirillum doebereinerae TaxID=92933 RepID=A0A3S0V6P5_9PROT|nr:HAMP domain-containing methyl-accepting chemotaxis protein [Azospirillum doebereinerae]RUQ71458.1 HAMP domain-containing protein [Azospirillum doebereinerae]